MGKGVPIRTFPCDLWDNRVGFAQEGGERGEGLFGCTCRRSNDQMFVLPSRGVEFLPRTLSAVLSCCGGSLLQNVRVKEWITRGKLNSFVLLHFLDNQRESITPFKENRVSLSVALKYQGKGMNGEFPLLWFLGGSLVPLWHSSRGNCPISGGAE